MDTVEARPKTSWASISIHHELSVPNCKGLASPHKQMDAFGPYVIATRKPQSDYLVNRGSLVQTVKLSDQHSTVETPQNVRQGARLYVPPVPRIWPVARLHLSSSPPYKSTCIASLGVWPGASPHTRGQALIKRIANRCVGLDVYPKLDEYCATTSLRTR